MSVSSCSVGWLGGLDFGLLVELFVGWWVGCCLYRFVCIFVVVSIGISVVSVVGICVFISHLTDDFLVYTGYLNYLFISMNYV